METGDFIAAEQFCYTHNIETTFVTTLQHFGMIETRTIEQRTYIATDDVGRLEHLMRLHYDLNINMEGLDAISHLLQKLSGLQQEVNTLRAQLVQKDISREAPEEGELPD